MKAKYRLMRAGIELAEIGDEDTYLSSEEILEIKEILQELLVIEGAARDREDDDLSMDH